jgi:hypothetical protein
MNDDLNRLIHTNAQHAFEVGVRTERERTIKLLETLGAKLMLDEHPAAGKLVIGIIELIKGEQK